MEAVFNHMLGYELAGSENPRRWWCYNLLAWNCARIWFVKPRRRLFMRCCMRIRSREVLWDSWRSRRTLPGTLVELPSNLRGQTCLASKSSGSSARRRPPLKASHWKLMFLIGERIYSTILFGLRTSWISWRNRQSHQGWPCHTSGTGKQRRQERESTRQQRRPFDLFVPPSPYRTTCAL